MLRVPIPEGADAASIKAAILADKALKCKRTVPVSWRKHSCQMKTFLSIVLRRRFGCACRRAHQSFKTKKLSTVCLLHRRRWQSVVNRSLCWRYDRQHAGQTVQALTKAFEGKGGGKANFARIDQTSIKDSVIATATGDATALTFSGV